MGKKEMLKEMIDASNIKDKAKALRYGLERKKESITKVYECFITGTDANFCIHILTGLVNVKK